MTLVLELIVDKLQQQTQKYPYKNIGSTKTTTVQCPYSYLSIYLRIYQGDSLDYTLSSIHVNLCMLRLFVFPALTNPDNLSLQLLFKAHLVSLEMSKWRPLSAPPEYAHDIYIFIYFQSSLGPPGEACLPRDGKNCPRRCWRSTGIVW